jgi:4-hydroxythreonine-4-phosphate dehydrogenase
MPGGPGTFKPAMDVPPLALSMGDPAGIGLEISLKAWLARAERGLPAFVLFADPASLSRCARSLGLNVPLITVQHASDACGVFHHALPVMPAGLAVPETAGSPDPRNGSAVIASIERAVAAVASGQASAVVTNPIAKSVLYQTGFSFPGHTEFLAELARLREPSRRFAPVMLLASDALKVVPLTVHIPLASVPAAISKPLIFEAVRTLWDALHNDFAIASPRIAVTGLNPHAGEGATMGREDSTIIAPAIEALKAEGLAVTGPHPADTLFHEAARRNYDAVVAMYHDQALIPIKTLAFDSGVNVTLGLPFVRTSPDHGTAFDIAGKGRANPESLIQALRMAAMIAARRSAARHGLTAAAAGHARS